MPKTVIVNSTPLIALAGIGELEILRSVYGQINIPKAVYNEVTVKSGKVSDAVRAADWINIVEIKDVDSILSRSDCCWDHGCSAKGQRVKDHL